MLPAEFLATRPGGEGTQQRGQRASRIFLVSVILGLLVSSLAYTAGADRVPAVRIDLSVFIGLTAVNLLLYIVSRSIRLFPSGSRI